MDLDKWITHLLAVLFSVALLGLVFYTVVGVKDLDVAKASMGFSAGILGAIIGFYFNRERLVAEGKARELASMQLDEVNRLRMQQESEMDRVVGEVLRRIQQEPEE